MKLNDLSKYYTVRDKLLTGDLLLWQTNGLIGGAIQYFTKSIYSHASLVLHLADYEGTEKRRFTTEATRHGVGINMLSRRLERQDGKCWWFPLIDELDSRRGAIGEVAISYLNVPYDFKGIFRFLFKSAFVDGEAMWCSELCQIAYGFPETPAAPCDILRYGIHKEGIQIL